MNGETATEPRIVVGVDGSASSKAALWWAVRQAELIDGSVEAVIAWHYPSAWYGWTPPQSETYDFEKIATEVLDEVITKDVGPDRVVEIRKRVVQGNAATALLEAARGAELLVVGNRGHGGFTETLLGSVSQHCVQHASCPVVVVRGPGDAPKET